MTDDFDSELKHLNEGLEPIQKGLFGDLRNKFQDRLYAARSAQGRQAWQNAANGYETPYTGQIPMGTKMVSNPAYDEAQTAVDEAYRDSPDWLMKKGNNKNGWESKVPAPDNSAYKQTYQQAEQAYQQAKDAANSPMEQPKTGIMSKIKNKIGGLNPMNKSLDFEAELEYAANGGYQPRREEISSVAKSADAGMPKYTDFYNRLMSVTKSIGVKDIENEEGEAVNNGTVADAGLAAAVQNGEMPVTEGAEGVEGDDMDIEALLQQLLSDPEMMQQLIGMLQSSPVTKSMDDDEMRALYGALGGQNDLQAILDRIYSASTIEDFLDALGGKAHPAIQSAISGLLPKDNNEKMVPAEKTEYEGEGYSDEPAPSPLDSLKSKTRSKDVKNGPSGDDSAAIPDFNDLF